MPMMVTDEVRIGKYSSVMFHNVAGGVVGNMTNTAEAAKFYEQHYNKFFADLYNNFFDEKELLLIQNGREIYLDAEAIQERLEARFEYVEEQEARDIIESYTHYKSGNQKSPATRWAGWFQSVNAANKKFIS